MIRIRESQSDQKLNILDEIRKASPFPKEQLLRECETVLKRYSHLTFDSINVTALKIELNNVVASFLNGSSKKFDYDIRIYPKESKVQLSVQLKKDPIKDCDYGFTIGVTI